MRTAVFILDRTFFAARADLAETISNHLSRGEIVQVEDSSKPPDERLRYTVQWDEYAGHVLDRAGHRLGVFADLDALVEHAETATV